MSVPVELVETRARFDTFFEDERERLFKALYFVTGNREDAEELTQDAFLRLWERWGDTDRIDDLTGYLFRVALNGFRMRRRRAATAVRKLVPVAATLDAFLEAEMRADVRQLLLGITPRQRRAQRNRKLGAFAFVAVIGLAAIALILVMRPGDNATTAANEPSVVIPVDTAGVKVATDFLDAFGAFDAVQAMTYLAEDADLTGMTQGEGVEGLSLMTSWLEASGYQQTITSCEAGTSGSDTSVVCAFDFHGIRSDEVGRGPFSGSHFAITIRDGEIVSASQIWEIEKFSPQMWDPFADWVSTTYPEDAGAMYNGALTDFRLTGKSIRLWEEHSKEYVKEVNRGTAGG